MQQENLSSWKNVQILKICHKWPEMPLILLWSMLCRDFLLNQQGTKLKNSHNQEWQYFPSKYMALSYMKDMIAINSLSDSGSRHFTDSDVSKDSNSYSNLDQCTHSVGYVFFFCRLCTFIVMCTLSCRFCFHPVPWLRFFRAFSSVVRQIPGYTSQRRGTARTLPNSWIVLFHVLFVMIMCCSMYCLIVLFYILFCM
jgi:hypothetical protein